VRLGVVHQLPGTDPRRFRLAAAAAAAGTTATDVEGGSEHTCSFQCTHTSFARPPEQASARIVPTSKPLLTNLTALDVCAQKRSAAAAERRFTTVVYSAGITAERCGNTSGESAQTLDSHPTNSNFVVRVLYQDK